MNRRRAAFGVAVATGCLLGDAESAFAAGHQVQTTVNGFHVLLARGEENEVSGGLEFWHDIRSQESAPFPDNVCHYRAWMGELHPPNQQLVFTQTTALHPGCTFLFKFYDWPGWESNYPENVRLRAKWQSDNTPGGDWWSIGDLTD
jgi:hypothetical protein